MLNKKKIKKILAISMALSMLFCNNAFATPIDLVNSTENVVTDTLDKVNGTDYFDDETTNEWLDGEISEEVKVTVDIESLFEVTIPKEIVLDGETGKADYIINAKGDIAGDQKLSVVPDAEFTMSEAGGKDNIIATITQEDTEYTYDLMINDGTDYNGSVEAILSAGKWLGKFVFNINFENLNMPEAGKSLEEYSWDEIAMISEAGLAQDYFNIGDEKTITLNATSTAGVNTLADTDETYTVQIIGFNHDDLSDGSGKAGITFQFKEVMTERYYMNSTATNVGGWEKSEMRTYVNETIYNSLPISLRINIEEVNKISDIGGGNRSTLKTTQDKLFLLSFSEIGYTTSMDNAAFYGNQGNKYEFFNSVTYENRNVMKKYDLNNQVLYWWTRSTNTRGSTHFCYDNYNRAGALQTANSLLGVAPAFCI